MRMNQDENTKEAMEIEKEINPCKQCGTCCINFGPVGLMILPWELKGLQERAKEINKPLALSRMAISDEKSQKNIIINYYVQNIQAYL